ncbi:heme utilization cystosolic carrier protein HutX [Ectothiorhodospira shaposhnikovii]|uniref:heme utilization cystosolic carrier protein HutX n=1 Tax=Ectothiorhodospira shaposhnikovii TaxID=1054 RepID=UPI001EE88DB8|nr:heme utilization cystosolic carrier protein HutX [Ectothiorhodospira shaposhnikovii]MCG5514108.1 heme utilization cystosolic carrier protein HutX [Ectothiorhodospira shaposhnikovii]
MASAIHETVTDLEQVRQQLAQSADGILEDMARQARCSMRDIIHCLPRSLWTEVRGRHFINVMHALSDWGDLVTVIHNQDVILEFKGPIPRGKTGHGFFNLHGGTGLSGHLRPERCAHIVFVRRPFMGMETASIQFFNETGECMFKVFLGRDEQRQLRRDQLDLFERLQKALLHLDQADQEACA